MVSRPGMASEEHLTQAVKTVVETVRRLRAPGGCPWDRAQTHHTLRPYLIEEAYEALEALDRVDSSERLRDADIRGAVQEELGDVLMQVLLHAELASEVGAFSFADIANTLNAKLIHRHPHVFGTEGAENADAALKNWERRKAEEKAAKAKSGESPGVLDGLPKNLPSLQRTERMIEKVSKVGFQWSDLDGPLAKVLEEYGELKQELKADRQDPSKIENELGDLLFSVCNLAYFAKIHPEDALRKTLGRFESRFRHVELKLKERGKTPQESNLAEMDELWNDAKRVERKS